MNVKTTWRLISSEMGAFDSNRRKFELDSDSWCSVFGDEKPKKDLILHIYSKEIGKFFIKW